ncbi:EAL domain-containing protein [Chitinibacter bivalviorum]|uniref:EAL domain-containing protein n=1 Tax=Chitinibacter bivalviorum TaxID=2739434 RepID=A0A7H9BMJ5_9NEIS|nr:GGDEF domain-containing phosphodiesterase [Chitinibacter bivalviorum]QLG89616.1 EAL domain-containing protein [Chitinibacter bivalviorum]
MTQPRQNNRTEQTITPRHLLDECITQGIELSAPDKQTAVIYLELRHLHPGHYRDQLLELMVERVSSLLRPTDRLFQLDSHSILLLLNQLSGLSHAILAANRAQNTLCEVDENELRLHPLIGIALAPEHGKNGENLIDAAKIAAHQFAQDHIGIYDPNRDWLGQQLARLESPLREALHQNRFHLVFQPQISKQGLRVVGLEVLLRWEDELLGAISPYEIISVAEHLGLMDKLTHWVIQTGLRNFAQLRQSGYVGNMSINLAPNNLRDPHLAGFISNALAVWSVPAEKVIFEITESAVIEEFELALKQLHQIKEMGCKLALDDFGTGYSSLAYLKRLPIDELKIDRSFVMNLAESVEDRAIVQSVIELAHRLKLWVTAEGVEDEAVKDVLHNYHCDVIQGFLYSKPLTLNDTLNFIQQRAIL